MLICPPALLLRVALFQMPYRAPIIPPMVMVPSLLNVPLRLRRLVTNPRSRVSRPSELLLNVASL